MDLNYSNGIEIKKFVKKKPIESPEHYHPYFELIYVRRANFTYFIEDKFYSITDKNIVLIDKHTLHKAIFKSNLKCSYFVVHFYQNCIMPELFETLTELFSKRNILLSDNEFLLIDLLFSKMYHEFEEKKENWEHMIYFQLNELIVTLNRLVSKESQDIANVKTHEIEKIIKYINSNVSMSISDLSLEKVSQRFFMTPSYLSRQFKKHVQIGFKDYVLLSKTMNAKILMRTTNFSVTEISYLCGFNDSNYFSTVFKKKEGLSPSAYIKSIKNN